MDTLFAVDSVAACKKFLKDTRPNDIGQMFHDIRDLIGGECCRCMWHKNYCSGVSPSSQKLDLVVFWPPCQPFSWRRSRSGATASTSAVETHPPFPISIDAVKDFLQEWLPRGFVLEQVLAFAHAESGCQSWHDDMVAFAQSLVYTVHTITMRLELWVTVQRSRLMHKTKFRILSQTKTQVAGIP